MYVVCTYTIIDKYERIICVLRDWFEMSFQFYTHYILYAIFNKNRYIVASPLVQSKSVWCKSCVEITDIVDKLYHMRMLNNAHALLEI